MGRTSPEAGYCGSTNDLVLTLEPSPCKTNQVQDHVPEILFMARPFQVAPGLHQTRLAADLPPNAARGGQLRPLPVQQVISSLASLACEPAWEESLKAIGDRILHMGTSSPKKKTKCDAARTQAKIGKRCEEPDQPTADVGKPPAWRHPKRLLAYFPRRARRTIVVSRSGQLAT